MTTTTNGDARKTLSSQLDRLDSILDGLSDALDEAVASAVQGAVERAVRHAVAAAVKETFQAVIAEALSNPDLLAAVRALLGPGTPAGVPADLPERPRGLLGRACDGLKAGLGVAAAACGGAGAYVRRQAGVITSVARTGWLLLNRFRGRLLMACGVGLATGAVTFLAGPWVAVAASSVAGFVTTLAVQAANGLRKLLGTPAALS
jgi:hypothetical protein